MSHFYASIESKGGQATRGGNAEGMEAHIRGWNFGIKVNIRQNPQTGKDEAVVYRTSGSNGGESDECIGRFTEKDIRGHTNRINNTFLDDNAETITTYNECNGIVAVRTFKAEKEQQIMNVQEAEDIIKHRREVYKERELEVKQ